MPHESCTALFLLFCRFLLLIFVLMLRIAISIMGTENPKDINPWPLLLDLIMTAKVGLTN